MRITNPFSEYTKSDGPHLHEENLRLRRVALSLSNQALGAYFRP